ncbi:CAP domain-containing protein [Tateyamaria sp. syn59]|uniref:CAP domain-containing protein n=1 Tax=Tateyamaria sp. syn59 TaxID=2576942 RepID=UPI0011BEF340|nr:CAP domain-containing protein [Tateyamaria sp. syn59]
MSVASEFERLMLDLINEERTSRGLDPLTLELRLNEASEDHSAWMENTGAFSHTGIGGSSAGDRMEDAGFVFSGNWTWGENIAYQSERGAPGIADDVADLHTSLMNSAGHRANILNPDFEVIGIGIETGDNRGFDAVYVTQKFAATSAPVQLDTTSAPQSPPVQEPTDGNDILIGSTGSDRLDGMAGNDAISGRGGDDILFGGMGRDTVDGGAGDDRMSGGQQKDVMLGGSGNDRISGNGGDDRINGGDANDSIYGGVGDDDLYGGSGQDFVKGSNGDDRLFGGAGRDTLDAGIGRDILSGGDGADRLNGGGGRDQLDGGVGDDTLTGGEGGDTFVFSEGRDIVRDFDRREAGEIIDLSEVKTITSFRDLVSDGHLKQLGTHAVIDDFNGNKMVLIDIDIDDFGAGDFLF